MDKRFQKIEASLELISKSIAHLNSVIITKNDLNKFATKSDLKGFATKKDLQNMNDQVNRSISMLATKKELTDTKNEINKSISYLATRDEMNTAIENSFDDLARMVAKGFESVDKRFDNMDKKFTDKIDNLEQKVDRNHLGLSNQLDYVLLHYTRREEHERLGMRVKRLEKVC